MRIGLDLDGVLFDFVGALERYCDAPCDFHAACRRSEVVGFPRFKRTKVPATRWTFYEEWGWSASLFKHICNKATDEGNLFLDGVIDPKAYNALWNLRFKGHDLIIITARDFGKPGEAERQTKQWLSVNDVPYVELHFTQDKTQFNVDVMLDDSVDILQTFDPLLATAVCWDQPWNQGWEGHRVSSWPEFVLFIEQMEAKVRDEDVEQAKKRGEEWLASNGRIYPTYAEAVAASDAATEQLLIDVGVIEIEPETILQEAQRLVHGDRGANYGHPIEDFTRTGRMWGAILGIPDVAPELVGLCMVALKMSREVHKPKRDNRVDLAGYAETVDMIATYTPTPATP